MNSRQNPCSVDLLKHFFIGETSKLVPWNNVEWGGIQKRRVRLCGEVESGTSVRTHVLKERCSTLFSAIPEWSQSNWYVLPCRPASSNVSACLLIALRVVWVTCGTMKQMSVAVFSRHPKKNSHSTYIPLGCLISPAHGQGVNNSQQTVVWNWRLPIGTTTIRVSPVELPAGNILQLVTLEIYCSVDLRYSHQLPENQCVV